MKSKIFAILVIILVSFSSKALTQHAGWSNYTYAGYINDLVADAGSVWICTNGGVVQMDTTSGELIFFNVANSGLPSIYVQDMAIDASGKKWFATTAGVAMYNGANWQVHNRANSGLPDDAVYAIAIDNHQNVFFQ